MSSAAGFLWHAQTISGDYLYVGTTGGNVLLYKVYKNDRGEVSGIPFPFRFRFRSSWPSLLPSEAL